MSEFASEPGKAKTNAKDPLRARTDIKREIALVEAKMRELFYMDIINDDVVIRYNKLESRWKILNKQLNSEI